MYLYEKMMKQKSVIAFKNLLFGRISEFRRHPEHEFRWQWQRSRHRRRWGPSEKLSAGGSRIERSIRKREQLKNLLTTKFMLTCSRSAEVENGRIFTNKHIVFSAAHSAKHKNLPDCFTCAKRNGILSYTYEDRQNYLPFYICLYIGEKTHSSSQKRQWKEFVKLFYIYIHTILSLVLVGALMGI